MKCEEGCNESIELICLDCEEQLCQNCSKRLHSGGRRKFHEIKELCMSCKKISTRICSTCKINLCNECTQTHIGHSITCIEKLNVYWDFVYWDSGHFEKILRIISEFNPAELKIYKKHSIEIYQRVFCAGITNYYEDFGNDLKNDLSRDIRFGLTKAIIITNNPQDLGLVISEFDSLTHIIHFDPHTFTSKRFGSLLLMDYMVEKYKKGKIILDYAKTFEKISKKFNLKPQEIENCLQKLSISNKIIIQTREYGDLKLKQLSVKLEKIDAKSFVGILRSLKLDEIFPCEKAIQSRIREAFGVKFSKSEWYLLLNDLKSSKCDPNFTFFSESTPEFTFQRIPYESEVTYAIYPTNEGWASSDQTGDIFLTTTSNEWHSMITFLSDFFSRNGKIQTMTGGKYGCSTLLKHFGGESLKKLSIGKLSYMVQIAINKDIIRYDKTLLIWTANYPVVLHPNIIEERVGIIKELVLDLLKSRTLGLPLAQIPLYLKRKLKFPLKVSELGYKKLKDLIKTMPEITLKLDSCKNPCAFYNNIPATISEIQNSLNEIIEKNKYCVDEEKLAQELQKKLGIINWVVYSVNSLLEFIDFYCKNIKVMKVGNEYIFIGRETEKEELSISTHNSEYFVITDTEEKCSDYNLLDINSFDN